VLVLTTYVTNNTPSGLIDLLGRCSGLLYKTEINNVTINNAEFQDLIVNCSLAGATMQLTAED